MSEIMLSRKVDRWVPRERWVASLSNGETIHEDLLPNVEPAWKRLGDYCKENKLSVTCLRMLIAGTEIKLPSGKDGYFQKKVAWATFTESGVKLCIGYVENGLTRTYKVGSNGDSQTIRPGDPHYTGDPGEPFTIYRVDQRNKYAAA